MLCHSWSGMFWCLWHVLLTILYLMNIQRNPLYFLCLGGDPVIPLNTLLGPKMRYLGNNMNILSLEAMKNMFEIAATNLKMA